MPCHRAVYFCAPISSINSFMKKLYPIFFIGCAVLFCSASAAQDNVLNFDGADDRVVVPANPAYDFNSGTVECRVRPGVLMGNACILGNRGVDGTRYSFHMSTTAIGLWNNDSYSTVPFESTPGQWYHLAFVCKEFSTSVYVDGNFIGETSNSVLTEFNYGYSITGQPLVIGAGATDLGGYMEHFNGEIDDVRIWNVERTGADIAAGQNATFTGSEPNLVALYQFNQGVAGGNNSSVTFLADASVYANAGTLENFALMGETSNWVGSSLTTLPVKLLKFTATRQKTSVLLRWQTAQEDGSLHFMVERSTDGRDFKAVGRVAAAGFSGTERSYSFSDRAPVEGMSYYRLRQVDEDGQYSFSPVAAVTFSQGGRLYWHEEVGGIVVQLAGGQSEAYRVSDRGGRLIRQGRLQSGRIRVQGLAMGIYYVQVLTTEGAVSFAVSVR